MTRITRFDVFDLRFPTSRQLDGSDAMNPGPGLFGGLCYSAYRSGGA